MIISIANSTAATAADRNSHFLCARAGCPRGGEPSVRRAVEAGRRSCGTSALGRLAVFDCRFTSPLLLPHNVGVYRWDDGDIINVYVGDGPGGRAYLRGEVQLRKERT